MMLNIRGMSTADSLLSVMIHPAALRVELQDLTLQFLIDLVGELVREVLGLVVHGMNMLDCKT